MPTLNPQSLDDAVERRWPRLFGQPDLVPTRPWPLWLALVLQVALATSMAFGHDEWAASLIGGTIGMLVYCTVIDPRLQRAHRG
jgi:hypothetical protein